MLICKRLATTAIAISLLSTAFAADTAPPRIDGPTYTQPQQMVEVEPGRRLNLHCAGSGSPTVVFESGLGVPISNWGFVQPVVAQTIRTCAYERAGLGFSDTATRASDSKNIVDDLHRLLVAAAVKAPYVLVGHSYGGMTVRLDADTVEPNLQDGRECIAAAPAGFVAGSELFKKCISPDFAQYSQTVNTSFSSTNRRPLSTPSRGLW